MYWANSINVSPCTRVIISFFTSLLTSLMNLSSSLQALPLSLSIVFVNFLRSLSLIVIPARTWLMLLTSPLWIAATSNAWSDGEIFPLSRSLFVSLSNFSRFFSVLSGGFNASITLSSLFVSFLRSLSLIVIPARTWLMLLTSPLWIAATSNAWSDGEIFPLSRSLFVSLSNFSRFFSVLSGGFNASITLSSLFVNFLASSLSK